MFQFVVLVLLMPLLASSSRDFPEREEYGPIIRPTNPTRARDLLGYDTFQKTAQNFNNVQYGNNWERYETPELKYNPEFRPNNYREDRRERYRDDDRDRDYDYRRDSYRDYRRNY